jgi:hypothetical protein
MAKNTREQIAARLKARGVKNGKYVPAVTTDPYEAPSSEQIARVKARNAARRKGDTALRAKNLASSDTAYQAVPFLGLTLVAETIVTGRAIRLMLIPRFSKKEGELKKDKLSNFLGSSTHGIASKPIKVAYGFMKSKNPKKKGKNVIAWITLSVPKAATRNDVIAWVSSFGKKPSLVIIGQQKFSLGKLAATTAITAA